MSAKQEAEVYDLNYLKYMRTLERGMIKPKPLTALNFTADTIGKSRNFSTSA